MVNITELGFPLLLGFFFHTILDIIFCCFTFFVYVYETCSEKRITNKKFLKSKTVTVLQTLGIIFVILPIFAFLFFIVYVLID